jgi:hypothetical protein
MKANHVFIVLAFTVITSISGMASEAWIETPEQPIRTWTPHFVTEAGWQKADASVKNRGLVGTGVRGFVRRAPFKGSLLRLHGLQNIRSHQQAVIKLESGTIRGWPVKSFSETDQDYLKSMAAKYVKPGKNDEKQARTVEYKDYKKEDKGKTYDVFESTYWTVWRGMDKEGKGKESFKPEFMPRVLKYMDQTWCFYKDALQIPMPWSDEKRQPFSWKAGPSGAGRLSPSVSRTRIISNPWAPSISNRTRETRSKNVRWNSRFTKKPIEARPMRSSSQIISLSGGEWTRRERARRLSSRSSCRAY